MDKAEMMEWLKSFGEPSVIPQYAEIERKQSQWYADNSAEVEEP